MSFTDDFRTLVHRLARWQILCVVAALAACSSTAPPLARHDNSPPAVVPAPRHTPAPAPASARSWSEMRVLVARRVVEANPAATYTGAVPEPLLAIPVLEIELNADGSIRHIGVLREPSQATDTTALAIAAVRRAAPFGSVAHLPRPWQFSESFLFSDDRRFKPRSLD